MEYSLIALGEVIRDRRTALGRTQEKLGSDARYQAGAGVSISRIEAGLTRPTAARLEGIAGALGLSLAQLEAMAEDRTRQLDVSDTPVAGGEVRIKDRIKRIQDEVERRTTVITQLSKAFNDAHDRARDGFFMRFVDIAEDIEGAPRPDTQLLEDDEPQDAEDEAAFRLRFTSFGVANVLAGGAGGAAAGAAVGGAAAYGTFMAAVSLGTASTGAAISGLSGVAASNAALALLGGGTLAAGGAGVAGGTMILTGMVAAPALLLAVGGLIWMVKRNRKQQQELISKLDEVDAQLTATSRGVEALKDILPRATRTLDYIAVHAVHALERWEAELGTRPLPWESLDANAKRRYQDFITISASQLAIVSINVQQLMASRDLDLERQIELADELLEQSHTRVGALV